MLNQQNLARTGGAIWKELPKVDLPKDTFTHLFTQHTVVKEKTETVSLVCGGNYILQISCQMEKV